MMTAIYYTGVVVACLALLDLLSSGKKPDQKPTDHED